MRLPNRCEMRPGGLSADPALSAEHRRMLSQRFPAVDPATRALAAERTRFSRRAYDRAIAATQDHPGFCRGADRRWLRPAGRLFPARPGAGGG